MGSHAHVQGVVLAGTGHRLLFADGLERHELQLLLPIAGDVAEDAAGALFLGTALVGQFGGRAGLLAVQHFDRPVDRNALPYLFDVLLGLGQIQTGAWLHLGHLLH